MLAQSMAKQWVKDKKLIKEKKNVESVPVR
jgi:hypothetical protein